MSQHTLAGEETGLGWPALASMVRVAGLVGRRLALCPFTGSLPWPVKLPDE
jgi:hypothetical protein